MPVKTTKLTEAKLKVGKKTVFAEVTEVEFDDKGVLRQFQVYMPFSWNEKICRDGKIPIEAIPELLGILQEFYLKFGPED